MLLEDNKINKSTIELSNKNITVDSLKTSELFDQVNTTMPFDQDKCLETVNVDFHYNRDEINDRIDDGIFADDNYCINLDTNIHAKKNIILHNFSDMQSHQLNDKTEEGSVSEDDDYQSKEDDVNNRIDLEYGNNIRNEEDEKHSLGHEYLYIGDQKNLTMHESDHHKMIDNDNFYLRNKDYFYKDQYYSNMHNKINNQRIYDSYPVPEEDGNYYEQKKCYEGFATQNYSNQYQYPLNESGFYNGQEMIDDKIHENQKYDNYDGYYQNYDGNEVADSPDGLQRNMYYEANEKTLMDRESYFDSFHQTPHGELKNTYYNPFVIKHRRRTSKMQLRVLEKTFETNVRPDAALRKILGEQLGMTPRSVQVWFQNRRAKIKKTKKREDDRNMNKHRPESYQRTHHDNNFYNHPSSMYFSPISPQEGRNPNQEESVEQRDQKIYDSANDGLNDHNYKNGNFLNH